MLYYLIVLKMLNCFDAMHIRLVLLWFLFVFSLMSHQQHLTWNKIKHSCILRTQCELLFSTSGTFSDNCLVVEKIIVLVKKIWFTFYQNHFHPKKGENMGFRAFYFFNTHKRKHHYESQIIIAMRISPRVFLLYRWCSVINKPYCCCGVSAAQN